MSKTKFSILIPTRERADVLYHAIKTCTTQDYENLSIIVSDNLSQDNTKDIIHSFNDKRIIYANTGKRLSMSHNYEFALSQVNDGYVCILGDDDGMLPGSLNAINDLIAQTKFDAINWKSDQYLWPSFKFNARANLLKISLDDTVEECEGKNELQKLISCKNGYERVPWLYKGFVNMDCVKKVKSVTGNFFNSMIPDVYSGIALANVIDRYLYSNKPYSLDAVSNHSNGASYSIGTGDKGAAEKFLQEENTPMHPGFLYCQSAYLLMAESVFQAISHGILNKDNFNIDLNIFFEAALIEVSREPAFRYDNVIDAIHFISSHFNMPNNETDILINKHPHKPLKEKFNYNVNGYNIFKKRIELDASKYGVENVFDACMLHAQIRSEPREYLTLSSKISSNLKFIIREIRKRY